MIEALDRTLSRIAAAHSPAVLASSLSAEDMVLTDAITRLRLPISVFVIDTGRLHADTLALVDAVRSRYSIPVEIYTPQPAAVATYVRFYGRDAFYGSRELRSRCCEIRKVEPLARALAGKRAWITGQRREHSRGRAALSEQEHDLVHSLEKFNPLAAWSEEIVWQYLRARQVPYNPLYDQGYRSIACAPCTRPVLPGEELRAGRWWWEEDRATECGLHVNAEGRMVRKAAA